MLLSFGHHLVTIIDIILIGFGAGIGVHVEEDIPNPIDEEIEGPKAVQSHESPEHHDANPVESEDVRPTIEIVVFDEKERDEEKGDREDEADAETDKLIPHIFVHGPYIIS